MFLYSYENNIETLKQLAKSELKWYSEYDGVAEYYEHEKNVRKYKGFTLLSTLQLLGFLGTICNTLSKLSNNFS